MTEPAHQISAILRKKRDGGELTSGEIQFVVTGAAQRAAPSAVQSISDAQLAAWLMAVFMRGLTSAELTALTTAMRFSGEVFDASSLAGVTVDKHSTGGVGDKTSFLVAPIAAAAGLLDPMISGRALGHTGGTLDKLESIPGFRTQLSLEEMFTVLKQMGAALVGQTKNLVPADRVLYALRDHTATVESPYLICASIMSKKLAAGLNALVLDVKMGSGAFLKDAKDGLHLASLMVETGEASGTKTVALLTDMNQPLGRFAGNWVEIQEAVEILAGGRHPLSERCRELSLILAGWMLHLGGKAATSERGYEAAEALLVSGAALAKFKEIVKAQGGELGIFDEPAKFHQPGATRTLRAKTSGYLAAIDCEQLGWAVQRLGAGRTMVGEAVEAHAGLEMHAALGSQIEEGQPLVTIFANDEARLAEPEALLYDAIQFSEERFAPPPLVYERVTAENAAKFKR